MGYFFHAKNKKRIRGNWRNGVLQDDGQETINPSVNPLLVAVTTALMGPFGFFALSTRAFIFAVCFYGLGLFIGFETKTGFHETLLFTHLFAIIIAAFIASTGTDN